MVELMVVYPTIVGIITVRQYSTWSKVILIVDPRNNADNLLSIKGFFFFFSFASNLSYCGKFSLKKFSQNLVSLNCSWTKMNLLLKVASWLDFSTNVLLDNSKRWKPCALGKVVNGGLNLQIWRCSTTNAWNKKKLYFAAALSGRLVAVGVEAFVGVTVTRAAGRRAPPAPRTLVVNPAQTPTELLKKVYLNVEFFFFTFKHVSAVCLKTMWIHTHKLKSKVQK